MHDIIQDLCSQVRDCETALTALAAVRGERGDEAKRLARKQALCESWLRVAGGEGALARMRAGARPHAMPRLRV